MRRGVAILLAALCLLSGCSGNLAVLPYAREIENMALLRTMGLDTGKQETVAVTVASGVQNKGADPPIVLSQEGESIGGACLDMQAERASYLFYGHVGQLLLGQGLAEKGVDSALQFVLQDIEMRLDTRLYVIKDTTAQTAITETSAEKTSVADRLEAMEDDVGLQSRAAARSVGDVLGELERNGCSFVPALGLTAGKEESLSAVGYGILKDKKLVSWAQGDAARGINLLLGQVDADLMELSLPNGEQVSLRVVGAETEVKPVFEGKKLTGLAVHCKVEANLAQAPQGMDLEERTLRTKLEEALAQRQQARLEAALALSQQLDADYLGLEKRAGLAVPWQWDTLQRQWDLPTLKISVAVEGKVCRSYDVNH